MQYVTVKSASEVKLKGIKAELTVVDKSIKAVILTDVDGNVVRVSVENYSNFCIQVPAPPQTEKKFVLRGELEVFGKVEKVFDEKYEAESAARQMGSDFKITEEDVPVPDTSKVDSDIPF